MGKLVVICGIKTVKRRNVDSQRHVVVTEIPDKYNISPDMDVRKILGMKFKHLDSKVVDREQLIQHIINTKQSVIGAEVIYVYGKPVLKIPEDREFDLQDKEGKLYQESIDRWGKDPVKQALAKMGSPTPTQQVTTKINGVPTLTRVPEWVGRTMDIWFVNKLAQVIDKYGKVITEVNIETKMYIECDDYGLWKIWCAQAYNYVEPNFVISGEPKVYGKFARVDDSDMVTLTAAPMEDYRNNNKDPFIQWMLRLAQLANMGRGIDSALTSWERPRESYVYNDVHESIEVKITEYKNSALSKIKNGVCKDILYLGETNGANAINDELALMQILRSTIPVTEKYDTKSEFFDSIMYAFKLKNELIKNRVPKFKAFGIDVFIHLPTDRKSGYAFLVCEGYIIDVRICYSDFGGRLMVPFPVHRVIYDDVTGVSMIKGIDGGAYQIPPLKREDNGAFLDTSANLVYYGYEKTFAGIDLDIFDARARKLYISCECTPEDAMYFTENGFKVNGYRGFRCQSTTFLNALSIMSINEGMTYDNLDWSIDKRYSFYGVNRHNMADEVVAIEYEGKRWEFMPIKKALFLTLTGGMVRTAKISKNIGEGSFVVPTDEFMRQLKGLASELKIGFGSRKGKIELELSAYDLCGKDNIKKEIIISLFNTQYCGAHR